MLGGKLRSAADKSSRLRVQRHATDNETAARKTAAGRGGRCGTGRIMSIYRDGGGCLDGEQRGRSTTHVALRGV